jgi:alpha-glucosidase
MFTLAAYAAEPRNVCAVGRQPLFRRCFPSLPFTDERGHGPRPSRQPAGVTEEPRMQWKDDWDWWKHGVIYQIYPRSFQDSDGDGCGDLPGIIERLDHLQWLGVDAVWISPFYPSPMKDFGYDVSDYTGVHPLFGTMDDVDRLLDEARRRGLRLIFDLVPNHSSDQHPWFIESSSSRDNPKRDWYLWKDPAPGGGPPNNWVSEFGGDAWQWHEPTGQYYYHAFLTEQPDLNWRNREVREAIYEVMRFWLDKGVDGFRVDVMWHMIKDEALRDNPPNPDHDPDKDSPYEALLPVFSTDQQEVHEVVREMRSVVDEYDERVLIGEIYLPIESLVTYYGQEEPEAHLPFNFQLIGAPWDAAHIRRVVDTYEGALPDHGWPNWVLGNHDKSRVASRLGPGQARVAAMLLLTLRGTPTLYFGEEIGMVDGDIPPGERVDPRELNCPGRGLGRDHARTPMQWDASAGAGFTRGTPWLPLADGHERCNVEEQRDDPGSMLSLYRRLLALRRREQALAIGSYAPLAADAPLFAWRRRHQGCDWLVVLNLSSAPQCWQLPPEYDRASVELSTNGPQRDAEAITYEVRLAADEGLLLRVPM